MVDCLYCMAVMMHQHDERHITHDGGGSSGIRKGVYQDRVALLQIDAVPQIGLVVVDFAVQELEVLPRHVSALQAIGHRLCPEGHHDGALLGAAGLSAPPSLRHVSSMIM